jgi:hypothetical protein
MREYFFLASLILLGGCASSRDEKVESNTQTHEEWKGSATIPLPAVQPDGSIVITPQQVFVDLVRDRVDSTQSTTHEEKLTKADVEAMIAAAKAVATPVVSVATGGWSDLALKIGGWATAATGGYVAIRNQIGKAKVKKAFDQTVKGINDVRSAMSESTWKETVAPHLEKAQDEDVRLSLK